MTQAMTKPNMNMILTSVETVWFLRMSISGTERVTSCGYTESPKVRVVLKDPVGAIVAAY